MTTKAILDRDWKPGYYYLSGPMTGRPLLNYPIFNATAEMLREHDGLKIFNPAEHPLESETQRDIDDAFCYYWGDYLSRDVKIVADIVDGVVVLPGWEAARGSRLEVITATMVGKPVYEVDFEVWGLLPLDPTYLGEVMLDYIDQWYERGV